MELQEQDIAMLEAYLAGELTGDALRACESRLQAEPALTDLLHMLQSMEGATSQTARGGLRKELQAAKAAAVAAGMASYSPAINAPKAGSGFLVRALKFLIKLAILGGLGWLVWKYVLDEQWPLHLGQSSTTKVETKSSTTKTIKRDTIHYRDGHPHSPVPSDGE